MSSSSSSSSSSASHPFRLNDLAGRHQQPSNTSPSMINNQHINNHYSHQNHHYSHQNQHQQYHLMMKQQGVISTALRTLMLELKSIQEEPVEGFRVRLAKDDNLFEWEVALFGPPSTLYEGGYFKATMKFPHDYPYSPPSVRFLSKVWHPNVYENGDLCISILHPPIDDPQSGELPCERWNPTQNVRTILLSVISLLNEPNTYSPANVDASVMYRRWRDSNGRDTEYGNIIRKQVAASRAEAEKDNIVVPTTLEEYCVQHKKKVQELEDLTDFYDDDLGYDIDNEDDYDDEL